ncbi:hypothetical protein JVU11DRAFT_9908 [Chiua virens]|nr:hypothetical protein JVU11DRAFT_9908 [Chiua virens]
MSTMKRIFPPLYQPTGDAGIDRLAFFHVLERLKRYVHPATVRGSPSTVHPDPSISDHMYRMAVLAMCTSDVTLDVPKCVMMCVVHDLAEAQGTPVDVLLGTILTSRCSVGDITPREGISKEEKRRLEAEAMHNFVHDMLHASPTALRIEALWHEYEEGVTPEAKFVKDLDRLEMALQGILFRLFLRDSTRADHIVYYFAYSSRVRENAQTRTG